MANEITALAKFTLDNGALKYTSNPGSIQIDQTTARMFSRMKANTSACDVLVTVTET